MLEWFDRHPLKHDIRIRLLSEAVNAGSSQERYFIYGIDTIVITEKWRGNVAIEAWVRPDSLVRNTLTFEMPSIDGVNYEEHILTYVPAEDSPLGKDVIYFDDDDTMPFVRE